MSDPLSPSTAWPAARPSGISPIQHPAWEEARNAILDRAAEGPITAVIVGEFGTGKTWLLRELASALSEHGFPTMMLMQGNLPMTLSSGAALLVDDASLMEAPMLDHLLAQQHGVAVLAGVDRVEDELDPASASPVLIRLRTLEPHESADFISDWLHRADLPPILDEAAISRLVARSGGRVGAIVSLLGEAVAAWKQLPVTRAEPPPFFAAKPPPPPRRSIYRPVLAASAIAAMIALGWTLMPAPPPSKIAQTAANRGSPLPALQRADTPDPPSLVTAAIPTELSAAAPPLVPSPVPELYAANAPPDMEIPAQSLAAPPIEPKSPGAAGLVLLAQRGDTLESLYDSVYRDRRAPPFARVLAANPSPFKPGAIVVFPEPPGGWERIQR